MATKTPVLDEIVKNLSERHHIRVANHLLPLLNKFDKRWFFLMYLEDKVYLQAGPTQGSATERIILNRDYAHLPYDSRCGLKITEIPSGLSYDKPEEDAQRIATYIKDLIFTDD